MVNNKITETPIVEAKPHYPALGFDIMLYQEILNDPSVPDEQKQEMLEILWAIAVACVDMGLGLHPLQQACGQFELYSEVPNMLPSDVVDCEHTEKSEFNAVNPASALDSNIHATEETRKEKQDHEPSL